MTNQSISKSDWLSPGIAGIIRIVATEFGVSPRLLSGQSRRQDIADARAVCMYILKGANVLHDEGIAKLFNRRRSTVCYCHTKVAQLKQYDKNMCRHFDNIVGRILNKAYLKR